MFSTDKKQASEFNYEGVDLEAMAGADNYYDWLANTMKPYIGKDVVEVGAGVGSFSKLLHDMKPATLSLLEPSKPTHDILSKNVQSNVKTKVQTFNDYLKGAQAKLKGKVDTFVYINVFEHIEDDTAELKRIADTLKSGGHAIVFVPALGGLYSEFDKSIGHYRRYNKQMLRDIAEKAGLEVVKVRYMDMPGILPWWLSFVLMKRQALMPKMVKIYDSLCVPAIRMVESKIEMPVGKNVLLIAKKK